MRIHNLGSVNIDLVYRVPHIPAAGETLASRERSEGLGGKGANMSIAAALSGASVSHYGAIGPDGAWTLEQLASKGVDTTCVATVNTPTGHAVIMVADSGENAITLFPGANFAFPETMAQQLIERAAPGDWLLVQNETSDVLKTARLARRNGLKVAYAAAPFDAGAVSGMLDHIDLIAMNEIEAAQLMQATQQAPDQLSVPAVLVTRGADGAVLYSGGGDKIEQQAHKVDVVDTTGAGDTFFGFFLGTLCLGGTQEQALARASAASALQIGRPGAAAAIPAGAEVDNFMNRA